MTDTLDQNIRGALETRLATVAGLPALAYEGVKYTPVTGTPFCEPTIVPVNERPSSLGDNHLVLHEGVFIVMLVYPNGSGAGRAEAMANAVKAKFTARDSETLNSTTVRFRYAERRPTVHEPDWIRIPIAIGFFVYDQNY